MREEFMMTSLLLLAVIATAQTGLVGSSEDNPMHVCSKQYDQPCASPPSVTYHPDPAYPEEARKQKLTGTVVLWTVITTEGTASHIRVAKSAGHGFDEAAIASLKSWRFAPGLYEGKPVAVMVNVAVNFKLY